MFCLLTTCYSRLLCRGPARVGEIVLLSVMRNKTGPYQGTLGCTPNSVHMVFIVFSRNSWGL